MAERAFHISSGMAVRSVDGKRLGKMVEVRLGSDRFQYLVVESRRVFGGSRLFVPVRLVESALPEGTITLGCTKRAARKQYRSLPSD